MFVNLGCGPGKLEALQYENYDSSRKLLLSKLHVPAQLLYDPSKVDAVWDKRAKFKNVLNLRFTNDTVDGVYSSHLLEHLYYEDALTLIKTIYCFLKPGGLVRFALPDYDNFVDEYISQRLINPVEAIKTFENRLLSHNSARPNLTTRLRDYVLGNLHTHKWHPTFPLVKDALNSVGYSTVERKSFRDSYLPEIELLECRNDNTFFIEAMKA